MDFDHLCTPMRGQPEMTPPEALTLPGATAAYIAKLEAQVEALREECAAHRGIGSRVQAACNQALLERDQAKARVAELETERAGWRDGVFVHPDHAAAAPSAFSWYIEKLERRIAVLEGERDEVVEAQALILADELAMYKAAFAEAGLEMYPGDYWVEVPNEPVPLFAEPDPQEPRGVAYTGYAMSIAFSAPALMSGPYMGED